MPKTVLKSVKYNIYLNIFKFLIEKIDILFETYFFLDIFFYKEPVLKIFFNTYM